MTRADGAGGVERRRQEPPRHRTLCLGPPGGHPCSPLQGPEYVQQRPDRRRRRDGQRPVAPGPGRRCAPRRAHEPGPAQARERDAQSGRPQRCRQRGAHLDALAREVGPALAARDRRAQLPLRRVRRRHHRRGGQPGRDQPVGRRHRQHGRGRRGRRPGGHGGRHRPGRRLRPPLRDVGPPAAAVAGPSRGVRAQQVPRRPRAAGPGTRRPRDGHRGAHRRGAPRGSTTASPTRRARHPSPGRGRGRTSRSSAVPMRPTSTSSPGSSRWPTSAGCAPPTGSGLPTSSSSRGPSMWLPTSSGSAGPAWPGPSPARQRRVSPSSASAAACR